VWSLFLVAVSWTRCSLIRTCCRHSMTGSVELLDQLVDLAGDVAFDPT
jgi:hypothetical protein